MKISPRTLVRGLFVNVLALCLCAVVALLNALGMVSGKIPPEVSLAVSVACFSLAVFGACGSGLGHFMLRAMIALSSPPAGERDSHGGPKRGP